MDADEAQKHLEEVRKWIEAGAQGAGEDHLDYIETDATAIAERAGDLLREMQSDG